MSEGWIFLHKKIVGWEWYDDANTFRLFMHLLLNANWENKKWRGMVIHRGQFVTSRGEISKKLKISSQQIRTSEVKLKNSENITIKTTNDFTLYSIINYEEYQSPEKIIANRITNKQQTNNKRVTTTKEYKELKEDNTLNPLSPLPLFEGEEAHQENIPDDHFTEFRKLFPKTRAGNWEKASDAFDRAVKRDTPEKILEGLKAYVRSDEVARGFAKGAAAWLNDDRWKSDYSSKPKPATPPPQTTPARPQRKGAVTL